MQPEVPQLVRGAVRVPAVRLILVDEDSPAAEVRDELRGPGERLKRDRDALPMTAPISSIFTASAPAA
jgi:hypothetical protein